MRLLAVPADGLEHSDLLERLEQLFHEDEPESPWPPPEWPEQPIVTTAVGPGHVAVLFEDGVVARVPFEVAVDAVDPPKPHHERQAAAAADTGSARARINREGRRVSRVGSAAQGMHGAGWLPSSSAGVEQSIRERAEAARSGMLGALLPRHFGARSAARVVAASAVPNELVSRVAEILPAKSRAVIVRQLQRSGLDVDAAIGALLTNEESEDGDEQADEPMAVAMAGAAASLAEEDSEEVMSEAMASVASRFHDERLRVAAMLEAHMDDAISSQSNSDEEDVGMEFHTAAEFASAMSRRRGDGVGGAASLLSAGAAAVVSAADVGMPDLFDAGFAAAVSSVRNPSGMSMRNARKRPLCQPDAAVVPQKTRRTAKPSNVTLAAGIDIIRGPRFSRIDAMHSGLLLVEEDTGKLWWWSWNDPPAAIAVHPRASALGFCEGRVALLVACPCRALIVTQNGEVAVVADRPIPFTTEGDIAAAPVLEQPATTHDVFSDDPIVQADVTATMSCAVTKSGKTYWWGLPPVAAREAMLKKHSKLRRTRFDTGCIRPGDTVHLKSWPVYRPGCIGFNPRPACPTFGRLLDTAWSLTDKCRFEVIGADGGVDGDAGVEEWPLDSVLFGPTSGTPQTAVVLKVDGVHAAVYFHADDEAASDSSEACAASGHPDEGFMWKHSRLMGIDELSAQTSSDDGDATRTVPNFTASAPVDVAVNGHATAARLGPEGLSVWSVVADPRTDDHARHADVLQSVECTWSSEGVLETTQCNYLPGNAASRGLRAAFGSGAASTACLGTPVDTAGALHPALQSTQGALSSAHHFHGIPALVGASSGYVDCRGRGKVHPQSGHTMDGVEVIVLLPRSAVLIPAVALGDEVRFLKAVETGGAHMFEAFANERADGGRNVLHALVAAAESANGDGEARRSLSPSTQLNAVTCLTALLDAGQKQHQHLAALLVHIDGLGRSPLIAALDSRCHAVAALLLKSILECHVEDTGDVWRHAGDVWRHAGTGATAIEVVAGRPYCTALFQHDSSKEQPAFECRTCAITSQKQLLCAACAGSSHLGHDVRYVGVVATQCQETVSTGNARDRKVTAPDAACTALTDQLLAISTATVAVNFDGETAIHSLSRQLIARRSLARAGPSRGRSDETRAVNDETGRVLVALASSWVVVEATLLIGHPRTPKPADGTGSEWQEGDTGQLDCFVFRLLSPDLASALAQLIETLKSATTTPGAVDSAAFVASRFMRAVVRVFAVLQSRAPAAGPLAVHVAPKAHVGGDERQQSSRDGPALLQRCRAIFSAFPALAISELAEAADAVVAPVRVGGTLPHASLSSPASDQADLSGEKDDSHWERHVATVFEEYVLGQPPSTFAARQMLRSSMWLTAPTNEPSLERTAPPSRSRGRGGILLGHSSRAGAAAEPEGGIAAAATILPDPTLAWAMARHLKQQAPDEPPPQPTSMQRRRRHEAMHRIDGDGASKPAAPPESVTTSAWHLSRLWGRLVKAMVDVALEAHSGAMDSLSAVIGSPPIRDAFLAMETQLERTWVWLSTILDSVETQLRLGASVLADAPTSARQLSTTTGPKMPVAPALTGESLHSSYVLSILRAHSGDHGGVVPALDVSETRHLAYLADGFVYYLQARRLRQVVEPPLGQHGRFFVRSESVCDEYQLTAFDAPLKVALPLAERPDYLQPTSTKSGLFGTSGRDHSSHPALTQLGLSSRITRACAGPMESDEASSSTVFLPIIAPTVDVCRSQSVSLSDASADFVSQRWAKASATFVHMFLGDVGREQASFLYSLAGFRAKEARFRERIDGLIGELPENSHDLKFSTPLDRERNALLTAVHTNFKAHARRNRKLRVPPFLCRTVKLEFAGEPGEGSGVVRSFLAAVCDALVQPTQLPPLPEGETDSSKSTGRSGRSASMLMMGYHPLQTPSALEPSATLPADGPAAAMECDSVVPDTEAGVETPAPISQPLFHSPGKPGYLSPVWVGGADDSEVRLAWFRHTGTLVGLALLHNNMFPMTFSRHVLKHLLGRDVGWHDLAFFDAEMYEMLRKAVVESKAAPKTFAAWNLTFEVSAPDWLGGATHQLVENGASIAVNQSNVHEYVALYAKFLLVDSVRSALDAMREGLLEVVTPAVLDGLSAEDFRLILNGCAEVDVSLLQRLTVFKNETSKDEFYVKQVQEWFWAIVTEMSEEQKHDLISFWTSSPSLPATEAGLLPRPTVVVRPSSEGSAGMLPTAHTCSAQLSIPVYPSIDTMRSKLLTALSTNTFGFV